MKVKIKKILNNKNFKKNEFFQVSEPEFKKFVSIG